MASKPYVLSPYSKMNAKIANILLEEGFVKGVEQSVAVSGRKELKIVLKYVDGESAIHEITRVSKPSRRVYVGSQSIKPVVGGCGISILTTNRDVMTDKRAKSANMSVGGELICTVW